MRENLPVFDEYWCDGCDAAIESEGIIVAFPTKEQGRDRYAFCGSCAEEYLEKVDA